MRTQGEAITHVMRKLIDASWTVVFFSMPNTAHTGVVPIPTVTPGASQRYPDVVATKRDVLLLAEIEPRLTTAVEREIRRRFLDHDAALIHDNNWRSWSRRVEMVTGVTLPQTFLPKHQLVICRTVERQVHFEIEIISADSYCPPSI
jgi:hypothetical protein